MSEDSGRDRIYANPRASVDAFTFDDKVVAVFEDMINRSVPGYAMILEMTGVITRRYAQSGTRCYDLGCSLGASTLSIRHNLPDASCDILAVDNSPAMVARCKEYIDRDTQALERALGSGCAPQVEVRLADIRDVTFERASLVVANFTLQFLAPDARAEVLRRIQQGLVPGGAMVLSEKIAFEDPGEQDLLTELHHGFKRARGYSDMEIAQKRTALENVLIPETLATHRKRLLDAGFSRVHLWFQCFNFVSMLAEK